MNVSNAPMSKTDWGLLILLSVLWGGSFFFAKVAVTALPPLTIVLVRFSAAAALVYAYVRLRHLPVPADGRSWLSFAGMGLLNNLIPAALIVWGQTMIPSGLASTLIATTPIFSILAIHFTSDDERLTAAKVTGMSLGLLGVYVLFRLSATDAQGVSPVGIVACLGAAVSYGGANAYSKRFRRRGIAPAVGALGQMTTTAIMVLPLALAAEKPWRLVVPDAAIWASMAGLVILSTALGYVIFFRLLGSAGATNISLVTLLIPVSATILGAAVLGEPVSGTQIAGMVLIASGLLVIDGRVLSTIGRIAAAPHRR